MGACYVNRMQPATLCKTMPLPLIPKMKPFIPTDFICFTVYPTGHVPDVTDAEVFRGSAHTFLMVLFTAYEDRYEK